jgi:hypothetical protein
MWPVEALAHNDGMRRNTITRIMFVNNKIITSAIVKLKLAVRAITHIAAISNAMSPQDRKFIVLPNPFKCMDSVDDMSRSLNKIASNYI